VVVHGAEPFAAMDDAEEGVRWSSPGRGGADVGPARRPWPWLAERQWPFDATMEIVDFWMAGADVIGGDETARSRECHDEDRGLCMAGAGVVGGDKTARAQPGRLLLCLGQRDRRAAHGPIGGADRVHIARVSSISTMYVEEH